MFNDYLYSVIFWDDMSEEQRQQYAREDMQLIYLLLFDGEMVPVYADDYGQQDVMVWNGHEVGGGCYNFNAPIDFCYYIDHSRNKL